MIKNILEIVRVFLFQNPFQLPLSLATQNSFMDSESTSALRKLRAGPFAFRVVK